MTVIVVNLKGNLSLKDFEETVRHTENTLKVGLCAMGAGESTSGPVNWASFQTDIPIDKPVVLQQMQLGSLPVKEGSQLISYATVFIAGNLVKVAAFR